MTRLIVIITGVATMCSCNPVEIPTRTMPQVGSPSSFSEVGGVIEPPIRWWQAFDDPVLDAQVDAALSSNLNLSQAWSRLAQAAATARITGASLLPEVNLTSSAARNRGDSSSGITYSSSWAVGFGLSWEIDLWRKIANQTEAAVLAALASRQDVDHTALLLTGTVTDTWFTIREQAELIKVIEEQIFLSEKLLQAVEYRYANGLTDALQVYQQRQQLEGVRIQLPPARSQLETSMNALNVLQGNPPEAFDLALIETSLPELPPLPVLGSPANLVSARPDLRAARDRLAAADHEVAAAVANMLPTISFSLGYDFLSSSFASPFNSGMASVGGSLLQPLFDGDRRGAEVVRRRAIVQERLDAFSEAFLKALQEVEDALDRERNQIELLAEIAAQIKLAERQLQAARTSYTDGVAEYLDVISAVQTQQSLQRQQVSAHKQLLAYRASLYRALGGTWMHELTPPPVDAELEHQAGTSLEEENEA
ncbi:MAG: TolC family protein [Planctomycetes bacterium]|jgi:NodT family efflux transporter outer membrane factor (OMF) lipoprotein|nr:TolC family protein [Planctomycetota bacterium]MCP4839698.1 TolC family protein [Planctomycetota bacterium]